MSCIRGGASVFLNPLLSLWENKNKSPIFNCRYSEHLSVYFLTEWLKSRFLVKVLFYKPSRLFFAESDRRGIRLFVSAWSPIQGLSPLSFIDSRTASVSFRLVTKLKTLTQLGFQPAFYPPLSTHPPVTSALWSTFLDPVFTANIDSGRCSPYGHIKGKPDRRFFVRCLQAVSQATFL